MNKEKIYLFSLELKKLLNDNKTSEVEKIIIEESLSEEEMNFLFMCLEANGYDPKTDMFLLFESDNSEFLKLVNLVQNNVSSKQK
ncbi:hypothetical protein Clocel_0803 [Clostridium cellulovorans 743B]|uniref:Uncharacterized protein n=1 Tax=Clostridium cellulovorans (strain ATCC 35296 / DSM 3052 / OCM 3 / 743B) TaxID=573061 RepID=D9SSH6_CLOC7|nr:hypothetical protein Clocel_0803 [Clostridium cellulovorans 743B]